MTHHSQLGPRWVVGHGAFKFAVFLFIVSVLYFGWLMLVFVGEAQGWSNDPAAWAGMRTETWAYLGAALYFLLLILLIALLVRREVPAKVYRVGDDGRVVEGSRRMQVARQEPEHRYEHAEW